MSNKSGFKKKLVATLVGAALLPMGAHASEADVLKKIEALQAEIAALKAKVEAQPAAAPAGKAVVLNATDGITIYGRLDLVGEHNDDGTVSRQVVQNISSRIGIKGERRITDDLSGIAQVETGVSPDDSANSGALASRNSYVGLKSGKFGSLIAGKHDMPFKSLEGTASQLWGSAEAMEIIIHGKGSGRILGAAWNNLHTRQTNVVQYWSPKFSNIGIKLAYSPDEVNGAAGTFRTPYYGASIEFNNGKWNLGLATETQENKIARDKDMSGVKATAGMKFDSGSFGFAYSTLDNHAGRKTNNWLLTGSYKLGKFLLKANYGVASETASNAADGLKMTGLELDYPLDKFTTVYGYYTSISNDRNARGRFEAGDNKYAPIAGGDPNAVGVGIRYNF
ncbi:MAG: porin [Sulfuritalea sp.]|nr:porin [Sulfuritalea sp.]MDP1981484.1 porin [Sulfuritalea sp.]